MPLIKKNSFCSTEISFFVQFYLIRNINKYLLNREKEEPKYILPEFRDSRERCKYMFFHHIAQGPEVRNGDLGGWFQFMFDLRKIEIH